MCLIVIKKYSTLNIQIIYEGEIRSYKMGFSVTHLTRDMYDSKKEEVKNQMKISQSFSGHSAVMC